MLRLLDKHLAGSEKTLHLLGDAAFTAPVVLNDIPASIEVTGRLNADARLHERTPQHQSGQVGRPRKRGVRLPNPLELLSRK